MAILLLVVYAMATTAGVLTLVEAKMRSDARVQAMREFLIEQPARLVVRDRLAHLNAQLEQTEAQLQARTTELTKVRAESDRLQQQLKTATVVGTVGSRWIQVEEVRDGLALNNGWTTPGRWARIKEQR